MRPACARIRRGVNRADIVTPSDYSRQVFAVRGRSDGTPIRTGRAALGPCRSRVGRRENRAGCKPAGRRGQFGPIGRSSDRNPMRARRAGLRPALRRGGVTCRGPTAQVEPRQPQGAESDELGVHKFSERDVCLLLPGLSCSPRIKGSRFRASQQKQYSAASATRACWPRGAGG